MLPNCFIAVLSDVIPKGYIAGFDEKLALNFLWLHVLFLPNDMFLEQVTMGEWDLE